MIKQLAREIPYWLRIVIAILFLNGFFAFLSTLLSFLSNEGLSLDPRIINIFIAFGLARKNKYWYVLGLVSISTNISVHILRLLDFRLLMIGFLLYFLLALIIDFFELYILLRKDSRTIFFKKQGES